MKVSEVSKVAKTKRWPEGQVMDIIQMSKGDREISVVS